jgi:hypothetical protein
MAWVVDTSVLLDIHTGDPLFELDAAFFDADSEIERDFSVTEH